METKKILEAINLASNREDLDFELAKLSMNEIMSGEVTPAQFGAFIIACLLYTSPSPRDS